MAAKILVVDDSASDRYIIKSILREHNVLTACDGAEAIRLIAGHKDLDIMILDLNMPVMNGFQVLSALKSDEYGHQLRTIILTNFDEPENEIKGLRSGAVDYIRKPIQMDALKARIDIHIEMIRIQRLLEQKLSDQALTFETIFNQAPIGIAISFHNMPVLADETDDFRINQMFEQITGRTQAELRSLGWAAITHPDDLAEDMANYRKLQSGEINHYAMDKRYIRPDGTSVWVHMVVAPLVLSNQHQYKHICLIQDISRRIEMEKALAESERSKSVLLSHLPGMAYRCSYDRDWTMEYVSDGCRELTGYPPECLICNRDVSFNQLISPEYREPLWNEWARVIAERSPFKYEYEIITLDGVRKWVMEMGQGIYNQQGEVDVLEGIILDISERKDMENHLQFNNEHDTWTGLYNRRYLENLLMNDARKRLTEKRALVGINLSSLQSLNIVYGFHYTWDLIKKVSDALAVHVNDQRLLFNMYENQFAFYIKTYQDKNELAAFCTTVAQTLSTLLTIERVNAGIGIVELDENSVFNVQQLFKSLLIASEAAIEADDEYAYCFFDREMEAAIVREDELKRELTQIADNEADDRLYLQFQPILDLKANQICGFEALARLNSHQFGQVSPLDFIPIAEETKLIIPLGYKIIRQAFYFLKTLNENGYDELSVSINISAIQLLRNDFTDRFQQIIADMKVNPANIHLEITESILAVNYLEINSILGNLKQLGIRIAIDDFGTGYSSLARERELNVNCLKIDKSFIDKLMFLEADEAITGDIISMAHRLGHSVVAEGVEHERQMQYLRTYGCDRIQGYLISRPLDQADAIELLKKSLVEKRM
ncbi:MAG: EAL domain-containing protein [Bacillota bacterium]|nr:EAL domain-containing protein [Bacillota bacterium]